MIIPSNNDGSEVSLKLDLTQTQAQIAQVVRPYDPSSMPPAVEESSQNPTIFAAIAAGVFLLVFILVIAMRRKRRR